MAKEKIKKASESEEEKGKFKVETMVSMYDPVINAYRDIPISCAKKFIEEAKKLEKQLIKEEK